MFDTVTLMLVINSTADCYYYYTYYCTAYNLVAAYVPLIIYGVLAGGGCTSLFGLVFTSDVDGCLLGDGRLIALFDTFWLSLYS